jgi:SAM-dependent methyltransferase
MMYNAIAPYYDLLHADLIEDVEFALALAEITGGPILELGCGTGRILLEIAKGGFEVTGLDSSEEMLAIARDKVAAEPTSVRDRVSLETQDIADFQLAERFGLAILPYNTLMHLNPPGLAFCLGCVHRHLHRGGALLIDVDNPIDVHDPGQDGLLLLDRSAYDSGRDEDIILMVSSSGDVQKQTRDTLWIVDASPTGGGPLKRTIARATLHYYFAHQLNQILESARFELVAQYGDYDRRPYDHESSRLLLVANAR